MKRMTLAAAFVACALIAFAAGTAVVSTRASGQSGTVTTGALLQSTAAPAFTTDTEQRLNNLYNRVAPSVVLIHVLVSQNGTTGEATGSGFVFDGQGRIVTNNHVVDGAREIEVNFFDGRTARAEIVGVDPDSDLAVIQVQNVSGDTLTPLPLADSSGLFVGQEVIAIGAPFNQAWTMTTGIVSALDRSIQGLTEFSIGAAIQTDAAINPGNSGGPLVDLQGRVIGVNSQIMSRSNSSSGIGFAIPSNLVGRVAVSLVNTGSVDYSYLGIGGTDVNLQVIESLSLSNDTNGVVVSGVEPGSPAAQAGLQAPSGQNGVLRSADIITAIDGQPVDGMPELIAYLAYNTRPGQQITLTVLRNGQLVSLPLTLSARP